MKAVGILLVILALICGYSALSMDVSVSAGILGRVVNNSLMAQRQIYVIVAGLIFIAGIVLFGFGVLSSNEENLTIQNASTAQPKAPRLHPADIECANCGVTIRLDAHELKAGHYSCPSCNTISRLGAAPIDAVMPVKNDPDSKECPMCAETIKYRAKICRFCNHRLEPHEQAAA
jgi:predicted RNA-binding Zn-ribbon protein involved in translation (DUF1610 family)